MFQICIILFHKIDQNKYSFIKIHYIGFLQMGHVGVPNLAQLLIHPEWNICLAEQGNTITI